MTLIIEAFVELFIHYLMYQIRMPMFPVIPTSAYRNIEYHSGIFNINMIQSECTYLTLIIREKKRNRAKDVHNIKFKLQGISN